MSSGDAGDSVVVSQLGARMHYAVPRILAGAGRLERLYTDICAVKGGPRMLAAMPPAALPGPLRRLAGRVPHGINRDRISCFPALGIASVFRTRFDKSRARETETALRAGRAFSAGVVRRGFGRAGGFYGFSGECLEQLAAARDKGLWTAVEQVIAPRHVVDMLVAAEAEKFPGWQPEVAHDPYAMAYGARETDEWATADLIVCPSKFVRDWVVASGAPDARCVVVPYGVDVPSLMRLPERAGPRRLHVLTVGAVGLRKGSPYVLQAAERLRGVAEFRLVGPVLASRDCTRDLARVLDLVGPVPRAEILRHFAWADVFLLPSVCEGSATATYEALGAGLPVVTTPNSGSVVTDGVDGFIVPLGDVDAICPALVRLADDRGLLREMALNARATGADHDIRAYGRRLMAALESLSTAEAPARRERFADPAWEAAE
jgi:glycosyltransferase involved in cell wall biosynthesis